MKPNAILEKALLLFFLLPVLLLVTCTENDDTNLGDEYRIIKSIDIFDEVQYNPISYEYNNNRMTSTHGYNDSGEEIYRTSIDYPDANSIVLVFLFYNESEWVNDAKKVLKLDGSHVIEVIYYQADDILWKPSSKLTYSYENDNLVEFIKYDDESGDWKPIDKTVYEYDGTKHLQTTLYKYANGWQIWEILVFTYTGNNVDYVLGDVYNDDSIVESYKDVFVYEGNLMKEQLAYINNDGSWIPDGSITYTYDSYNNLESYSFPTDESTYKVEYKYEKGSGNYMQLLDYNKYDFFLGIEPHPTKAVKRDSIPIFFNFDKKIL